MEPRSLIYPKGTTKEDWDEYERRRLTHENQCDIKQEFAARIIKMVKTYGSDEAYEKICTEIRHARSMDAPNEPGYYRATTT